MVTRLAPSCRPRAVARCRSSRSPSAPAPGPSMCSPFRTRVSPSFVIPVITRTSPRLRRCRQFDHLSIAFDDPDERIVGLVMDLHGGSFRGPSAGSISIGPPGAVVLTAGTVHLPEASTDDRKGRFVPSDRLSILASERLPEEKGDGRPHSCRSPASCPPRNMARALGLRRIPDFRAAGSM